MRTASRIRRSPSPDLAEIAPSPALLTFVFCRHLTSSREAVPTLKLYSHAVSASAEDAASRVAAVVFGAG